MIKENYLKNLYYMYEMEFQCPRCHYTTTTRQHLIYHLYKKTPCSTEYDTTDRTAIIDKLQEEKRIPQEKLHVCDVCNKSFAHASGLSRHKRTHIENVVNNQNTPNIATLGNNNTTNTPTTITSNNTITDNSTTNINNSINDHSVTNNDHRVINDNSVTNNTTNNNTTNNIHIENVSLTLNIVPFGNEDIKEIEEDKEFLDKCMRDILGQGIPNIIEKIFFNEKLPQNHNVKLHSLAPPQSMMVYCQDSKDNPPQWEQREIHQTLDQMIDKGYRILVKHKDQLYCITDRDIMDFRNERFSKIKKKERGIYGPIKNGVLIKAKVAKEAAKNSAT
jgi:hypothetical protein